MADLHTTCFKCGAVAPVPLSETADLSTVEVWCPNCDNEFLVGNQETFESPPSQPVYVRVNAPKREEPADRFKIAAQITDTVDATETARKEGLDVMLLIERDLWDYLVVRDGQADQPNLALRENAVAYALRQSIDKLRLRRACSLFCWFPYTRDGNQTATQVDLDAVLEEAQDGRETVMVFRPRH